MISRHLEPNKNRFQCVNPMCQKSITIFVVQKGYTFFMKSIRFCGHIAFGAHLDTQAQPDMDSPHPHEHVEFIMGHLTTLSFQAKLDSWASSKWVYLIFIFILINKDTSPKSLSTFKAHLATHLTPF